MKFRDFLNYNILEAGNSASKVTWRRDGNAKIGEFTVTSQKTGVDSEFTIVVNKKDMYKGTKIKNMEIYEFKFYDAEGNIEVVNNMEFMLGVGPTIKREFCSLLGTKPDAVIFSADKYEKSRVKYYDKFATKVANDYGYEVFFKTAIYSKDDEYCLVRDDKVEAFKQNFETTKL